MSNTSVMILVKSEKMLTTVIQRNLRAIGNDADYPPSHLYSSEKTSSSTDHNLNNQGVATLFVMIAVLTIIILFCCFSAPGIRSLCKRYIFRSCRYDDPDRDNASNTGCSDSSTGAPTVILLSNGRMLVVDRNIFDRLQVDSTGLDLMELSSDVINAQRRPQRYFSSSTPSVDIYIDSENTSKGITPTSLGYSPPNYDEVFGKKECDLPPSYSEVSFMLKTEPNWGLPVLYEANKLNFNQIQETTFNSCSETIVNSNIITSDAVNVVELGYNSEENIVVVNRRDSRDNCDTRNTNSNEDLVNNNGEDNSVNNRNNNSETRDNLE